MKIILVVLSFLIALLISIKSLALSYQGLNPISSSLDLATKPTYIMSLNFKNNTTSAQSISYISGADGSFFLISNNRCKNVAAGKSCLISISSQRKITPRPVPYSIQIADCV